MRDLCSQIYWRHHRALDLIYEHRFVRQETTRKTLLKLVEENPSSIYNSSFTKYPRDCVIIVYDPSAEARKERDNSDNRKPKENSDSSGLDEDK